MTKHGGKSAVKVGALICSEVPQFYEVSMTSSLAFFGYLLPRHDLPPPVSVQDIADLPGRRSLLRMPPPVHTFRPALRGAHKLRFLLDTHVSAIPEIVLLG